VKDIAEAHVVGKPMLVALVQSTENWDTLETKGRGGIKI